MASQAQSAHKMPIYKQADFECSRCESIWQADYSDIANLRANKSIHCKNCKAELVMNSDELQTLNNQFEKSEKVSKRTVIFIIPYFLLCGVIALTFGGLATFIMLLIGFMIILTIRRSLTPDGIDHFNLMSSKKAETNPTQAKNNKITKEN